MILINMNSACGMYDYQALDLSPASLASATYESWLQSGRARLGGGLPEAEVNCQSPKLRPEIKKHCYLAAPMHRAWLQKVYRLQVPRPTTFGSKDPMVNDLAVVRSELPKFFSGVHDMVPLRTTCRLYSGAKAPEVGYWVDRSELAGGNQDATLASRSRACGRRLGVAWIAAVQVAQETQKGWAIS